MLFWIISPGGPCNLLLAMSQNLGNCYRLFHKGSCNCVQGISQDLAIATGLFHWHCHFDTGAFHQPLTRFGDGGNPAFFVFFYG